MTDPGVISVRSTATTMRRAFSGAAFVLMRNRSGEGGRGRTAIDFDELGGHDRARLPVDLHDEVASAEVFDRAALAINGRDVDGQKVDLPAEASRLRVLRGASGRNEHRNKQRQGKELSHGVVQSQDLGSVGSMGSGGSWVWFFEQNV